ncbi:Ribosomal protein S12p Asp88 methylthiotransferase [Desulfurella amilsii]|uniref:Ribosomal protein uS12 methylthiotransferase RimO n=1 Tax=Desulfurella amilsii TaxID=1562698 RepID=A0A1X4XV02_9BACT|nr:30S ribosomal protein S12 methylthiotransferase RimO [Desulfurella amilsii]OSS41354.1 Ribosomal protein S12p Asp88 methylthiotransferase [Desulfurella amilsii]
MKCYLVSLGCPKNLVDTENILYESSKQHIEFVYNPEEADILLVNTCAFIQKAIKESIHTILEIAQNKKENQKLVVAGCLIGRFKNQIESQIPEVDIFIDTNSIDSISLDKKFNYCNLARSFSVEKRIVTTYPYAYLRISDGCNHRCSFCTIPQIRGSYREKNKKDIESEFLQLIENGIKEVVLIAQDTSCYNNNNLSALLKDLSKFNGDFWVRVLYLYPSSITDDLIETIASSEKIVPYFDIPLQHVSDKMLKLMRRNYNKKFICELFDKLLKYDVAIRSTFIVGFPYEEDKDFKELMDFTHNYKIDRLGAFEYSKEENTKSASYSTNVPYNLRRKRRALLLAAQKNLSRENLKRFVGKKLKVLIDSPKKARSYLDAPEIDGSLKLKYERPVGDFVEVTVSKSSFYDLFE